MKMEKIIPTDDKYIYVEGPVDIEDNIITSIRILHEGNL